jgi:hypothetical protein
MCLRLPWPSIRPISPVTNSDVGSRRLLTGRGSPARPLVCLVWVSLLGITLAACQWRANPPTVLKIGVIAPFEGVGRELGYALLPAVSKELASANASNSLGQYRVALVALNDDLDPAEAALQAKALAEDPDVLAVVGLWSEATARSAVPILQQAGVPSLLSALTSESGAMTYSLCPSPEQVVTELLRGVHETSSLPVVLTGPDNALRRALLARAPELAVVSASAPHPCAASSFSDCLVIHTGEAVDAADTLVRWRAAGWQGPYVVGPDAARPWFGMLTGVAGEGVRAVACGILDSSSSNQDASLQAATSLVSAATQSILSGLGRVIANTGLPTRQAVAEALSSHAPDRALSWIQIMRGNWVSIRE